VRQLYRNIVILLLLVLCGGGTLDAKAAEKKSIVVKSNNKDITKKKIYIQNGTSVKLTVDVYPEKSKSKIVLKSANSKIVSVKKKKIKAVKKGSTKIKITATDKNKNKISTYVKVKVVEKLPNNTTNGTYKDSDLSSDTTESSDKPKNTETTQKPAVSKVEIKISSSQLNMLVGERQQLKAWVEQKGVPLKRTFSWRSSNSSVIRIKDGILTGLKPGKVTITAGTEIGETIRCEVIVKENTSKDWLQYKNVFRISAHRGAVKFAPENTLEAITEAIDHNYGAIELDPRISADGEVYLMHDSTVDRTTNGTGSVSELTSEEMDSLFVKTDQYPDIEGSISVAKFEDAVKLIAQSDLVINVDGGKMDYSNKETVKAIVDILKKYGMTERTFFVISDKKQRAAFCEMYPYICVSWLYSDKNDIEKDIAEIKQYKRAMLSVHSSYATKERIDALNKAGIYYQVYSVDKDADAIAYQQMGVPMIETNYVVPWE